MRIGVVGTGHLGNIHLKCLKATPFEIIGVYDINPSRSRKAAADHSILAYGSLDELIANVDALSIVSDTTSHGVISTQALKAGKHIFVEKPITANLEEAKALAELQTSFPDLKAQVGHVERYNPAFREALEKVNNPMFIECHRLATFNPRGNDVSVILDLMIHDLDILLTVVRSPISEIRANGVKIISSTPDICNARIEFENGCVANMTASRLSLKQMRKFRIFQGDAYIGIDFLEKTNQVIQLSDVEQDNSMTIETAKGTKYIEIKSQQAQNSNAIEDELNDFYQAIVSDTEPVVNIKHAVQVMELAHRIEQNLKSYEEII